MSAPKLKRTSLVLAILALSFLGADGIFLMYVWTYHLNPLTTVVFEKPYTTIYALFFLALLLAFSTAFVALSLNSWQPPLKRSFRKRIEESS